jgi:acetylornithine/N-succinyldiaminopimelate aminotransferase
VLGHINTFGGHPVCCAAGMAAFKVLLEENLVEGVKEKEALFVSLLSKASDGLEPSRRLTVRSCGLMIAVEFDNFETNKAVIDALITEGVFTDWFLFASNCLRIVPPLTMSDAEIKTACEKISKIVYSL